METTPKNNDIFNATRLLSPKEVAEALNVSKLFVYKLVNDGQLPAIRFSKFLKISPADLREFLANHRTVK